jgi:hypothetical protein
MIFTKELLEKGKSSNNGWNRTQLFALGLSEIKKGWAKSLIGSNIDSDKIKLFLDLKDSHFKDKIAKGCKIKKKVMQRMEIIEFEPVFINIEYKDQYLHPNWQKMRTFVLTRDKFSCVNCKAKDKTLHVHHLKYNKSTFVWDIPHWYLVTLCEDCHSEEHNRNLKSK